MAQQKIDARIINLINELAAERNEFITRAVGFRESDPIKAAYLTGCADGRNEVGKKLTELLNQTSITKGDNRNGR